MHRMFEPVSGPVRDVHLSEQRFVDQIKHELCRFEMFGGAARIAYVVPRSVYETGRALVRPGRGDPRSSRCGEEKTQAIRRVPMSSGVIRCKGAGPESLSAGITERWRGGVGRPAWARDRPSGIAVSVLRGFVADAL